MNEPAAAISPPPAPPARLDLAALRARLASAAGPQFWRGLEEVSGTPEFNQWLHREFPQGAAEWTDTPSRRQFLKIMAASFALAGVTACTRQPTEYILPYVKQPEELIPGIPLQYATAMTLGGYATGILVESHEGRPTKIEGNPDHPMSLGAANVFQQASILELYDPDRSQSVRRGGEISSWEEFLADLVPALAEQGPKQGAGLRILTETVTSPTLAAQLDALLKLYPKARWHQYEPWNRDNALIESGNGRLTEAHYDFSKAKVIVSLDSDFLFSHPASLAYARQFSNMRRAVTESPDTAEGGRSANGPMSRLYVAEPTPSITGTMADVRLACGAAEIGVLVEVLAGLVEGNEDRHSLFTGLPRTAQSWVRAAARDLYAHSGEGVVVVGEGQPGALHDTVYALNKILGNAGQTVFGKAPAEARTVTQTQSLKELADAMHAGQVDLLVQIGGNPVYNAPADLDFAGALGKVKHNVQLALSYNETSEYCQWHIPECHYLESWGDARAFDGTVSIIQPLVEPLYQGRTVCELLDALVLEQTTRGAYDIVRAHWQNAQPAEAFDKGWRKTIHDGLAAGTALPLDAALLPTFPRSATPKQTPAGGLEIVFKPDPAVWDGRFANNGWLQELPKPITKLTWDNAALVSPRLAERLHLANGDVIELAFKGRTVHAPVWIVPGQAENSVTLTLGYGRTAAGHVGTGQGVNAYALRTSDAMGFGTGLEVRKIEGAKWQLATTQSHQSLAGRNVYRTGTLEEFRKNPEFAPHESEEPKKDETLYPPDHTYPGYAWGMAIDLNTCIGCNACVIACQAENNIPIVGKGEVINGREMHWIRVDGYFAGNDLDNPEFYHQPVPCMQCENAPCEVVCPVEATVHSPEGLNEQVYNRCIGTRYCSNNCPYKVRRFNFLQWADNTHLTFKMQRNPDVTVRSRGVMEKCTYCVQRINEAKITSQKEDRRVRDNEIVTACQQTCPTEAIVFGDVNDPASRVSRLKKQTRNYGMLAELGTRPRTTYLARITNPNPEARA